MTQLVTRASFASAVKFFLIFPLTDDRIVIVSNFELSPLDEAIAQLKTRGIKLTVAPAEYIVNYAKGRSATEYRTDDLADALAHGLAMEPAPVDLAPLGPMGKGRPSRRAKMYAHNRKIAARRRKAEKKS